jgi:O-methyltransferase
LNRNPLYGWLRNTLIPRLQFSPAPGLEPERLYVYLDTLYEKRELDGSIVEIGAHRCGTAAIAFKFMKNIGKPKRYVCVDTFSGFVPRQFDHDVQLGTPDRMRHWFSGNSFPLVQRLLRNYECEEIELIDADIVLLDSETLPDRISVLLLDVDLYDPTYAALGKCYSKVTQGGIILVDDCLELTGWKGAMLAYRRFCEENGLPKIYIMGMGRIEKV